MEMAEHTGISDRARPIAAVVEAFARETVMPCERE